MSIRGFLFQRNSLLKETLLFKNTQFKEPVKESIDV